MPASGTWSHNSRPQVSSVVKWPDTTITPRPPSRAAARCSRPSISHVAAQGRDRTPPRARELEHADSQRAEMRAQQRIARGVIEFGKHIARLRAATSRRVRSALRSSAPNPRPSTRCSGHGSRPMATSVPMPSHDSHVPGARGGGPREGGSEARVGIQAFYRSMTTGRWRICDACRPPRQAPAIRYAVAMRAHLTERAVERLLRGLYSVALYVLVPITVYHLIWRGFRQKEYFQRWNERYGVYDHAPHASTVWIHAVSVGEVNAAAPLVNALRTLRPDLRLLVTTITPTGSARVQAIWNTSVEHVYLPYDLPVRCRASSRISVRGWRW
jgi:hypothetical protein